MHISSTDIKSLERISRASFINSLSGLKPTHLIGTSDADGNTNLAIFSSVVHLGSNPALLGMVVRPASDRHHTYKNIKASGRYTINHVHSAFVENAHYTSAKFEADESEFIMCGLQTEYIADCPAPFVKESRVKMAMKFVREIPIEENGTTMIIGEITDVVVADTLLLDDGSIDLHSAGDVSSTGSTRYHEVAPAHIFPYARKEEMPDLRRKKERPDLVAYDEETESYNAAMLPYATSVSGPAFKMNDLTQWKNNSVGKVSAHFKTKFEEIKSEYQAMVDQFSWNEIVYTAKFSFEPVVGETYHLYERENEEKFLSLIPPKSWKKTHLGSFQLSSDKMWIRIDE